MKKLKLYSLRKGENHSVFHIEKDESFLQFFRGFLHALGFLKHVTAEGVLVLLGDVDDNFSARKYSSELYQDKYVYFEDEELKIDLFFGKERVILSIFSSSDQQERIINLLLEFCELLKETDKMKKADRTYNFSN